MLLSINSPDAKASDRAHHVPHHSGHSLPSLHWTLSHIYTNSCVLNTIYV